jgi:hypothetical protein
MPLQELQGYCRHALDDQWTLIRNLFDLRVSEDQSCLVVEPPVQRLSEPLLGRSAARVPSAEAEGVHGDVVG